MTDEAADVEGGAPAESRPSRMEDREQLYGLILAGLCLSAIAIPWIPKMVSGGKGAIWKFLLSLGTALVLGLAARKRQRVIGMFAAAFAGLEALPKFVPALVVQFVCLVFAGWLMLRTNRAQRAANQARRRMTPTERAAAREEAREAKAARRRGAEPDTSTGRRPAAASKRYTPPKKKKAQPR